MKLWLEKNDIEMYSTHNEGKSFISERFIITFLTFLRTKFISIRLQYLQICILIN